MAKKREILGTTGRIRFDVTQEHRTGGNGASYVVKNYRESVNHPAFQQEIKLGNAYGYHGHPTKKILKDGKLIEVPVLRPKEHEATPTHVCTFAAMDGKYCIHEQAFLDTIPGKNVFGLWKGNTGGFSSRASTIDGYGGRYFPTKLARMAGMDFVHDRSYRYNSFEGVIATEAVMPELTLEYLIDDLKITDKTAHFVCNGGFCPKPGELALEEAVFLQVMENELALEDAHKIAVESAFKRGFEENLDNEKRDYREQIEEFEEEYIENRKKERTKAQEIAIECVRKMPRKPHLDKEFFKLIAPSLVENGEDEAAMESVFYEIFNYFTGYNFADFAPPKEEFVNVSAEEINQPRRYFGSGDRMLIPRTRT